MTPPEHRALAETLADRVYRDTGDPQALAHVAVVHALLATGPAERGHDGAKPSQMPPGDDPRAGDLLESSSRPVTWQGWVMLLLILGIVLGVVALVTQ